MAGFGIWKPGTWPLKGPDAIPLAGLIGRALRGKSLTRAELSEAVKKLGASPRMANGVRESWGGSLRYASFLGSLCFAPSDDREPRFTHPETWLRAALKKPSMDEAFLLLTRRFLSTYGPATTHDFGPRWWGINQGEARRRIAALGDEAREVTIEGERYWMLAEDVAELETTEPVNVVRLLAVPGSPRQRPNGRSLEA